MSHQQLDILNQWSPQRDSSQWVLGVVYSTAGSAYRKAGALMLFGSEGQQLGMLSGGCLESDLHSKARRVMHDKRSALVRYDGNDEDDMAFQMGIGCGGTVDIMLQVVEADNHYLGLTDVLNNLRQRISGYYDLAIGSGIPCESHSYHVSRNTPNTDRAQLREHTLIVPYTPPPHLFVAGGGIDARPLVDIAHTLGWHISLWDPRPAHGRREHFQKVHHLLDGDEPHLQHFLASQPVDIAVVMSHSVSLDAQAVKCLSETSACYIGLLGPDHRMQQVLSSAGITKPEVLAGPAGLSIGGTLPESIAMAILAEAQAKMAGRQGGSISGVLDLCELSHC